MLQMEILEQIGLEISSLTGMPMTQIDFTALIDHIKRLDGNHFATMPEKEMVSAIASGYLSYSARRNDVIFDVHEIMKQYLGGGVKVSPSRFLLPKNCGTTNGLEPDPTSVTQMSHINAYAMDPRQDGFVGGDPATGRAPEPKTQDEEDYLLTRAGGREAAFEGVPVQGSYLKRGNTIRPRNKSTYFLLDSRYRVRSTGPSVFTWAITPLPDDARGVASAQAGMANVVKMEVRPFYIPYVPEADTPGRQVSMLVEELGMAAVIAHENRNYHILFNATVETNRILLEPVDDTFNFNEPIDHIKRVSLTFANPLIQLNFLPDFYAVTVTYNAPNSTYINFAVEHFVADGEVVIITGFTTANPGRDFAVIGQINDVNGNSVAVVDDYTLEITPNLAGITLITPSPSVDCYILSRRIQVPLRFASVI